MRRRVNVNDAKHFPAGFRGETGRHLGEGVEGSTDPPKNCEV